MSLVKDYLCTKKTLRCALIQIGLQGGRHINLFVFKPLKAYMFIKVLLNLTFILLSIIDRCLCVDFKHSWKEIPTPQKWALIA